VTKPERRARRTGWHTPCTSASSADASGACQEVGLFEELDNIAARRGDTGNPMREGRIICKRVILLPRATVLLQSAAKQMRRQRRAGLR